MTTNNRTQKELEMKNTKTMKPTEEYNDFVVDLLEKVEEKVGKETINEFLIVDGLPIMILRLLFGYLSSSNILLIYLDRFGVKDCENDLEWLKRTNQISK